MDTDDRDSVDDFMSQILDFDQFCEGGLFEGLKIKPLTKRLVHMLTLDLPLPPPLIADFGVKSPEHYGALKDALFYDSEECEADSEQLDDAVVEAQSHKEFRQRIVELDAAYGNAAKLNAFLKKYAPEYVDHVHFAPTGWDYIYGRVEPDSNQ